METAKLILVVILALICLTTMIRAMMLLTEEILVMAITFRGWMLERVMRPKQPKKKQQEPSCDSRLQPAKVSKQSMRSDDQSQT